MPKIYSHTVSVVKDSNKVIACSESDCDLARVGAYFRPKNSKIVYQIIKVNPIFPIYDFEVMNLRHIRIKQDTGRKFLREDILDISYKEYQLASIFEIISVGKGYSVDDIIKPDGGVTSYEVYSGLRFPAEIVVNEVGGYGEIMGIGLKSPGKYITAPPQDCSFVGGTGSGAVLKCDFELLSDRQLVERTINLLEYKENETNIFLDYNLPEGLKEGKLSVKKIELILDKPYQGETDLAAEYEITNDMTSNYQLPLLVFRGVNSEAAINHSLVKLDTKIKELEDRIKQLEST